MDTTEKSFAQAIETSKYFTTIAAALVAYCATIINVNQSDLTLLFPHTTGHKVFLALVCVVFGLATVLGLWTQLAVISVLAPRKRRIKAASPTKGSSFEQERREEVASDAAGSSSPANRQAQGANSADESFSVWSRRITLPFSLQVYMLALGVVLLAMYTIVRLFFPD